MANTFWTDGEIVASSAVHCGWTLYRHKDSEQNNDRTSHLFALCSEKSVLGNLKLFKRKGGESKT